MLVLLPHVGIHPVYCKPYFHGYDHVLRVICTLSRGFAACGMVRFRTGPSSSRLTHLLSFDQFWSWSHQFRYLPTGSCAPWACWGSPSSLGGVQMFVVRYLHILCVVFSAISPAAVSVLHLGPLSRGCGPCVHLPCCPCCILAWAIR